MNDIFLLVDCNNFYASCERVFEPSLRKTPVAVLSNNDGCIIARSNELKAAGVGMGAPYFQVKSELEKLGARVFSANFALYGDMSDRVMSTLGHFTGEIEIYSIDEAFLKIPDYGFESVMEYAELIRKTVYQWTGIPVSIGIGKTKTLAKAANFLAKKKTRRQDANEDFFRANIFNLYHHSQPNQVLKQIAVEDLWGVGRKYSKMLKANGVETAYQLSLCGMDWVGQKMTIVGQKLVRELNGVSCFELDKQPVAKKNIACTRSFPTGVTDLDWISQSVATYCTRIGEKLRQQGSVAGLITVFVITNRFDPTSRYFASKSLVLETSTNHTPDLIKTAQQGLQEIFREGLTYKKAGVYVSALSPVGQVQANIFDTTDFAKQDRMMLAIDRINKKYGRDTIKTLASGLDKGFRMRQEWLSKRYTTDFNQLLEVK